MILPNLRRSQYVRLPFGDVFGETEAVNKGLQWNLIYVKSYADEYKVNQG
jgi:hypothetical protein